MPRLSVLMPAFNAAETVHLAVGSVLRDLPRDSELVVLDDGSTDDTRSILDAVGDPRVRIMTGPHEGVGRASQSLLESTDSEYIARMDSDDVWLPGRARRQLRALEAGVDAVFTTIVLWRGHGLPRPTAPSAISPAAFPFQLLLTNPVAHSTMMARRSEVADAGGYRPFRTTEDYDLFLRLAGRGGTLRRLALPGVAYRVHAKQTTASEEWRAASWRNPEIAEAYSRLAQRLLGAPAQRISSLSLDDALSPDQKRAAFESFATLFEKAIEGQSRSERWMLRRKLGERRSWLLDQLRTQEGNT